MFRKQVDASSYFGAIGVHRSTLSDTEILHAAVKNLNLDDGFVKSITIFDKPAMAVLVIDRADEILTRRFSTQSQTQRYQITLQLIETPKQTNMCELTYAIKSLRSGPIRFKRNISKRNSAEDWVSALQSKLSENLSKTGARAFPTLIAS